MTNKTPMPKKKKTRKDSDYFGAIRVSIIRNDPGLIKLVSI